MTSNTNIQTRYRICYYNRLTMWNATGDLQIRAYYDSDYAACPRTRRSLSSYVVHLQKSSLS